MVTQALDSVVLSLFVVSPAHRHSGECGTNFPKDEHGYGSILFINNL